jgi:50S ribosomal protein L16 3-hydroxylase
MTEFGEKSYDQQRFFAEYWRRKPMFIRGGAVEFLGRVFGNEDFDAAYATAAGSGELVKEVPGEVTFLENVSAHVPDLRERAERFSGEFAAPRAWFDAIRTYAPSGIGAHFDHSDNFVLQQNGVKHWTLAAPTNISRGDLAKRMLNLPGVGAHDIPQGEGEQFVLEPGDLLYIPLFWLHHGVSEAASLSISLVCPAVSLYSAVVPFLNQAIKRRGLGHQPIPALHAHLSPEERGAALSEVRRATIELLQRMSDEETARMVESMQDKHLLSGAVSRPAPE